MSATVRSMRALRFGFSPCPNDTFAFHALAHGLVEAPFRVEPVLLDIEELNRRARGGELELTKLSFGALAGVGDRYRLLDSGAALGFGCGPLVVAREPIDLRTAAAGPIAVPGLQTTALLLLRRFAPALGELVELRYDRILGAVESGEVKAGLIIHESRFTYAEHGLVRVCDLGQLWEDQTGLPVPLAGICARSDLDADTSAAATQAIRASVEYAFSHPGASHDYVRANAQELSEEVCQAHIELYVNESSLSLGETGMRAIESLLHEVGASR
ncbi:MAG: 1,4-dihydroxy-6-naphthoate synthase [Gaiellaceae bacterium]